MNPDIRKTVPPAAALTSSDTANAVAAANVAPARSMVWAEVLFWLVPVAAFFLFPGYRTLGGQILIAGLFALSLDLILGYARIVSLGHAAFFGLGAYTAGLLAKHSWGEPISGLIAAAAVAAVAGLITSALIVRGKDLTRLIVTLGIGLMLYEAANRLHDVTGGVDGLSGVEMKPLLGRFEFGFDGTTAYVYILVVVLLMFLLARRIVRSPFGLSLKGIREGEKRMPAIGVSVAGRLAAVYTVSAALAGVAGGLLAQTTQFVGIDVLSFTRSAEILIMLVVGGAGYLYGGLIGAAIFMVLQDQLSNLSAVYWQFWLGLLLVCLVLFARGGVMGALTRVRSRNDRSTAMTTATQTASPQGRRPSSGGRP